jgi:hypothetical protein
MRNYEPLLVLTAILTVIAALGYAVYGLVRLVWVGVSWLVKLKSSASPAC